MTLKHLLFATVVYGGFFGLIGFTVWFTGSAWALWALLLMPEWNWRDTDDD
jgi:hypothetical protein